MFFAHVSEIVGCCVEKLQDAFGGGKQGRWSWDSSQAESCLVLHVSRDESNALHSGETWAAESLWTGTGFGFSAPFGAKSCSQAITQTTALSSSTSCSSSPSPLGKSTEALM